MGDAARVLALPTLLCADDVQRQLRCSRAEAYDSAGPRALAAVKPRQNRKSAQRAADMQRDEPPSLRIVRGGRR